MVLLAFAAIIINDLMGNPVSGEAMTKAIGALGAYVVAQGIADHGSQGKKADTVIIHGSDEGPNWEDTSELDDADKKGLLE